MPIRTTPPEEVTLNLTPMIDVILTLILFFMVASRFTEAEKAIDLTVPTVSDKSSASAPAEPKVINVLPDGHILLGTRPISLEELTKELAASREQGRKQTVLVRGDRGATHGRMTEVYEACRKAGINELAISVKVDAKKR